VNKNEDISKSLVLIFKGIQKLQKKFPHRRFTIDGRLVGDLGEIIAEIYYEIRLHQVSQRKHDAVSFDGRNVQIKATFKNSLTFSTVPEYFLGLKLNEDGTWEEIFNGPGKIISNFYKNRKGIGRRLIIGINHNHSQSKF
jgi:hypothetical protein